MKSFLAAAIVALLVLQLAPASAGVDVDPRRKRASLILKASTEIRPSLGHRSAKVSANELGRADTEELSCFGGSAGSTFSCSQAPDAPTRGKPGDELTEGDILNAVREIGLPSLKVRIQPGTKTLVNIETIFYTRPEAFERSIDLLGFDIDLVAAPVSYRWIHDDGTTATTSRPGKPYPAMDVTHRYRQPADNVRPRVDVTYRVRYRVDGGGWQTIGPTLLAAGPAAELDVREAAPVLTKP